ncbi:unnamed protein product [Sphagnum tenellum]
MTLLLIHLNVSPLLSIVENAWSKVGEISSIISWKNSVEMSSHPSALSFGIAAIASLTSFKVRPLRVLAGRGLGASPGVEEGCHACFLFQEGYVEVGGSCGRGGGAPPNGICEAVLQSQLMPGGCFSPVHPLLPYRASGFHLFQMVEVPTDYGVVGCEDCLANLFPQEGPAFGRSRGVRVDNS